MGAPEAAAPLSQPVVQVGQFSYEHEGDRQFATTLARGLEVLLVHPGGPFWRNKDNGAWSIPKGEIDALDDPEQVARREFAEELGHSASIGPLQALGRSDSEEGSASSHSPARAILTRRR